ncbi:hypothetical protein [Caballeronia temeraria]|uniref:hypothetical protein n=1 Tax=Caballeronia temeraria TaxID=1777137 RepID=UPI0012FDCE25|nr:hypothetical protein [Caballeronia temeraria]
MRTAKANSGNLDRLLASGGELVLVDPESESHRLFYGRMGTSIELETAISTLRSRILNAPVQTGTADSPNLQFDFSPIYMTDAFRGQELSHSDLRGACVYVDAGRRFLAGVPAMLLGINAAEMSVGLSSPADLRIAERAIARAPAVLLLRGATAGLHARTYSGVEFGYLN